VLSELVVAGTVVSRDDWRPYPRASDRAAWDSLPQGLRDAWLARGAAAAEVAWPRLTASAWLEFDRTGDRGSFEVPHHTSRLIVRDLVMAECVAGDGRHVESIVDAVWSMCEESSWTWPACLYMQRDGPGLPNVAEPVVDLGAGETAGLLAWTWYVLGERLSEISPLVPDRIEHEITRRILTPYLERDDFWWQQAVNNWNTWIHGNVLSAVLCVEKDDARRTAIVAKVVGLVEQFLERYSPDGGCDEGATYWARAGGCLNQCLELIWSGTGGAVDGFAVPVVAEIARFPLHAHIAGPWFVNFADGRPQAVMPGDVIWRMARRVGDAEMTAFGAQLTHAARHLEPIAFEPLGWLLPGMFDMDDLPDPPPPMPVLRDVWLPDIQFMTARSAPTHDGLFLAAKGGHNDEVHNHNDVGNFVVYLDGRPVVVDAGVGTYTRDTFGEGRYGIWTMQSAWHNVPVVAGVDQAFGRKFAAADVEWRADDDEATLTADLGHAYPEAAGIVSWHRMARLDRRAPAVEITDTFELREPSEVALTLLVACAVDTDGPIVLTTQGDDPRRMLLEFDPALDVALEAAPMDDPGVASVWPDGLTRIRLRLAQLAARGSLTIRLTPTEENAP